MIPFIIYLIRYICNYLSINRMSSKKDTERYKIIEKVRSALLKFLIRNIQKDLHTKNNFFLLDFLKNEA